MSIKSEDYRFLAEILEERSGLELGENKEYLLESRLQPIMEQLKVNGIAQLVDYLRCNGGGCVLKKIVDAMTTNESLFFRDGSPFEVLSQYMLPHFMEARKNFKSLRIWSAACSTGQEPFSIAISIAEHFENLKDWKMEIVATDLCEAVLQKAQRGVFSDFEVQRGLDPRLLQKYFDRLSEGWQLKESILSRVHFRELNLLDSFHEMGTFDIVFCRNVLIYFGVEVKKRVLEKLHASIASDGYLVLGGAESVLGITEKFTRNESLPGAIFRPR